MPVARCVVAASLALLPLGLAAQKRGRELGSSAHAGVITAGQTIYGELTRQNVLLQMDSTYAQEWRIDGTAGQVATIELASNSLDAYVFLVGPGIAGDPLQDDDSGGNCNARLTVRFPQTREYRIVVTSRDRLATGPFTLTVTAGSKPTSLTPCNRPR